jgi:hypothetical protein
VFEERKLPLGTIKLLRSEDSVKDRLASYFYWQDRQGLEQAIEICLSTKVSMNEIREWSQQEGHHDRFNEFFEKFQQRKGSSDK